MADVAGLSEGEGTELWNDAASCPARTRAWPAEGHCVVNLAQGALGEGCIEEQAEQPSDAVVIIPMTRTWGCQAIAKTSPARVRASSRATMKGRVLMLPQSGA